MVFFFFYLKAKTNKQKNRDSKGFFNWKFHMKISSRNYFSLPLLSQCQRIAQKISLQGNDSCRSPQPIEIWQAKIHTVNYHVSCSLLGDPSCERTGFLSIKERKRTNQAKGFGPSYSKYIIYANSFSYCTWDNIIKTY